MTAQELQKKIESFHYWDARVSSVNCNYFADEVDIAFSDGEAEVIYKFTGCYKSIFDHVKKYDKLRPVREMTLPQIPYSLQDIEVGSIVEDGVSFYTCKVNMFPLYLDIWCKNIEVMATQIESLAHGSDSLGIGPDRRAVIDIEWGHPDHHGLQPGQAHLHYWNWTNPVHPTHYQPGIHLVNFIR